MRILRNLKYLQEVKTVHMLLLGTTVAIMHLFLTLTNHFFSESRHHRTFQFLCQMKKNTDMVLWTERNFQRANSICRGSPLYVSQELWNYFFFWLRRQFCYT